MRKFESYCVFTMYQIFSVFYRGKKMREALSPYFSHVSDPCSMRNQHHPFLTIIGVSFLSVLSGIDSFSGMQIFAEAGPQ
jgi:hypothetical protein